MRQENEAHAQVLVFIQMMPQPADLLAENLVRQLGQQPRAVAGLGVGVERAAVAEVAERLEPVAQHEVGTRPVDLGDKPDAAGIVFVFR